MKKLFSLIAALALVLTLAACDTEIVYKEVEVEVPVKEIVTEYIEVEVPVEKIVEVEKIITETITEYVDVPADVENERFYKPGVYFNNTEIATDGTYTYAVVIVDAYGKIAGIMFDDTKSTSEFLIDEAGQLYVYVEGDGKTVPNTYRAIATDVATNAYPTAADAITADDLVVGIHTAAIAELTAIEAYETSRVLGEAWIAQTDALVEAIIEDQGTYGVLTSVSGDEVTAVNVDTKLTNVDVLLGLVEGILTGEAALTEEVELATTPVEGLYTPGYHFGVTERLVKDSIYYYTSFVAVDEYGRISGVYNDVTLADKTVEGGNATKWILKEAYGMNAENPWYLQAKSFGEAVVKNQGTAGFNLYDSKEYTDAVKHVNAVAYKAGKLNKGAHAYTDQIAGATIGIEGLLFATEAALANTLGWEANLNDGTYLVTGEVAHGGHATMAVTISEGAVESIFLDNTTAVDQATVLRDEEWLPVYKFDRIWETEAGEEEKVTMLVYLDTDEYVAVNEYTIDTKVIDAGDEVTLTEDELAALEVVPGNYTKQILNDRYGMNAENDWYMQANLMADTFEAVGPYGINLTDGTHTDITGVTFGHIEEYQQLFVDALLLSINDKVDPMIADVEAAEADELLPNGTYFASLEVNTKGQQYIAYMNVEDGFIQSIVFDAVLASGDVVTTKNSLGDDYGMKKTKEQLEWYEQAALYANAVVENQDDIINGIENTFTYELGAEFGNAVYTGTDAAAGVSISTDAFKALTNKLVEQALIAKIEMEANAIFAKIAPKTTLFYSEMDSFTIGVDSDDFVFGTEDATFELDWESTDNDVLDVDETTGTDPLYTYDFVIDEVSTNTEITMTYVLTFDEYEFTKDITYTVQTVAAAELGNLNADKVKFKAFTQVEGYDFELPTISTVAGGTFLGWFEADVEYVLGSGITDTTTLDDDTHTLTAVVEYAEGKFVTRELTVTVMDEEDALEEVMASVKPANILNNGEVTSEETFTLPTETGIKGVEVNWFPVSGFTGDVATLTPGAELTILRSYETHKVVVQAIVVTDGAEGMSDSANFEFRAVPATTGIVKGRVLEVIKNADLGVMYFDTNTNTTILTGLDAKLGTFGPHETGNVDIEWETNNAAVTINGSNELVVVAGTEGTVKVTATITVELNEDTEVEVTKEFEIILFDSVA